MLFLNFFLKLESFSEIALNEYYIVPKIIRVQSIVALRFHVIDRFFAFRGPLFGEFYQFNSQNLKVKYIGYKEFDV